MKMDIDDEGTKTNESTINVRAPENMEGDNTQEQFEQNMNNSQQSYDRNGMIFIQYSLFQQITLKTINNFSTN